MRWYWWVLIGLVVIGWLLRVTWVWDGAVSFHYDMSRDAFEAEELWRYHQPKVLGPPTTVPGLYHGVGYYYLIAPLYGLGQGDPRVVAMGLALLSSLTVWPIFLLSRQIFKNNHWGLVSALLFTFSFEAIQYGPWISNPNPGVLTVAWFFYWLYQWVQKRPWALVWTVVWAALSLHFQFFLTYLFLVIVIFGIWFKVRMRKREILVAGLAGTIILSPFVVAIIKFRSLGLMIDGFRHGVAGSDSFGWLERIRVRADKYVYNLGQLFSHNFVPQSRSFGLLLLVLAFLANFRSQFIWLGLLSSLPIFIFGGHSNAYVNLGLITPAVLAMTGVLVWVWDRSRWLTGLLLVVLLSLSLTMWATVGPTGQPTLVIQTGMLLKTQLAMVDKTYQLANGQPFSINTITVPYWTNTTWAYLYHWYGRSKYGYVPSFYGQDQIGIIGASVMEHKTIPEKKAFLIIEDLNGLSNELVEADKLVESYKTHRLNSYNFGNMVLEERTPINEK